MRIEWRYHISHTQEVHSDEDGLLNVGSTQNARSEEVAEMILFETWGIHMISPTRMRIYIVDTRIFTLIHYI